MKLILTSLCALAALCATVSCSPEALTEQQPEVNVIADVNVENDDALVQEILSVVNAHRTSIGLSELSLHDTSEQLALNHSAYMAERNKASHDYFFARSDYLVNRGAEDVSENVAFGFQTAESALEGWLNSPSHREALEGENFTHTGIAVVRSENGIKFYTQLFVER